MEIDEVIARAGGPVKLGRIVGRHHTTIRDWKQVPSKHLSAVAAALNIPVEHLLPAPGLVEQDQAA